MCDFANKYIALPRSWGFLFRNVSYKHLAALWPGTHCCEDLETGRKLLFRGAS